MPNDLINTDPIVAQNFYLDIGGEQIILIGVSGLDIELDIVATKSVGADGKSQTIKTRGNTEKIGDLTVTRLAPMDATKDPIWEWFDTVRDAGFKGTDRAGNRKAGSVIFYDAAFTEVARFNFTNAWPAKISTDAPSADSNDPVKETITFAVETLQRVK